MEKKKNIWVGKIVVIVLIIVSIGSYYVFPSVKHVMNQVFKMFASGDFAVVRDFVASYGAYAALISFLLIFFQVIFQVTLFQDHPDYRNYNCQHYCYSNIKQPILLIRKACCTNRIHRCTR